MYARRVRLLYWEIASAFDSQLHLGRFLTKRAAERAISDYTVRPKKPFRPPV